MDARLLQYYERELRYLRELGGEFAQQFPKIAARLGLSALECTDPHVERLLQGFSFMAARVHMRFDAEFPRFTGQLMERVHPHFLAPTPSMAVVRLEPDTRSSSVQDGCVVPRDTPLFARLGTHKQALCEYRTRRAVALWPFQLEEVEYTPVLQELAGLRLPVLERAKALVRIRLRAHTGVRFDQLPLDRLPLFIPGTDEVAVRLYQQLVADSLALVIRSAAPRDALVVASPPRPVRALGFDDDDALLPDTVGSFQGYRLLQEYFAFPSAFSFVELCGLESGVRRCGSNMLELLIPLKRHDPLLDTGVHAARLCLFATPAINLFPRDCAREQRSGRVQEIHVVPDQTRPLELEVHSVSKVAVYGSGTKAGREFRPKSASVDANSAEGAPYYTLERRPHESTSTQQRSGSRNEYVGGEVFLSLVDGTRAAHASDSVGVSALCTNRGLPLLMCAAGLPAQEFSLSSGVPVAAAHCVAAPTAPRATPADGDFGWRLLSQLSLNYLSLCDSGEQGARALREMLALYAELGDPALKRHVEDVRSVSSCTVVRPLPGPEPQCFARGLEVTVECEQGALQGRSAFLLVSVLARFFAKYASSSSFVETVLRTASEGEVFRWPTMVGLGHSV
jgi:type VI secretion system protein ImpG